MRKIYKQAQALEDIAAIVDYYSAIRLELALRFLDALDETLEGLLEWPGKGVEIRAFRSPVVGLRRYSVNHFKKYCLYYRIIPDGIELVHVMHGARDRESFFGK